MRPAFGFEAVTITLRRNNVQRDPLEFATAVMGPQTLQTVLVLFLLGSTGSQGENLNLAPIVEFDSAPAAFSGPRGMPFGSSLSNKASRVTVTVQTASELAAALRNQTIQIIDMVLDVNIGFPAFGGELISVQRDVTLRGPEKGGGGVTLSSSLRREVPWLSLESGHLVLDSLHLGNGMFELDHEDGHMPVTFVGASLYGEGFSNSSPDSYCGCTAFTVVNSLVDAAIAPHRTDRRGVSPVEVLDNLRAEERYFAKSVKMQSIYGNDRWGFLDFNEVPVFAPHCLAS